MGIEPTRDTEAPHTGFEDQARHQSGDTSTRTAASNNRPTIFQRPVQRWMRRNTRIVRCVPTARQTYRPPPPLSAPESPVPQPSLAAGNARTWVRKNLRAPHRTPLA
jgi:hypothetical protein